MIHKVPGTVFSKSLLREFLLVSVKKDGVLTLSIS